jgi:sulfite reductase alpha subunit-like flavoprotein
MRLISRDVDDQIQLERWIETLDREDTDAARRQLTDWLGETYHTVLDLFDAFPDCVPTLDVLIDLLPRIRPRLYSIGSSPVLHPRAPRIMAGVLSEPRRDGRIRRGLASHYLAGLEPGAPVHVEIKQAGHHLPDDFAGPLLLVGAGTGLAPLFGMLEDRVARGIRSGALNPVALYFGCRNEAEFLERDQLISWRRDGHLARLSVALSRQAGSKAYVQDAIDADGALVWDILRRPDCRFVICGDAKMAQDVEERLMQILRREIGDGYASAMGILNEMKAEGRYIEDVWGVQLNRAIALPEMVRSRYDRGAGWLGRIQQVLTGRIPDSGSILRY